MVIAAACAACGNTSAENAELAKQPLAGGSARIKIYRTEDLIAAGGGARIKLNGKQIADMGIGGSLLKDVPAGSHQIVVDHWGHPNVYAITLKAKPGMFYTLEVSPRVEAAIAGGLFGLAGGLVEAAVNENGGPYQIKVVDAKPLGR
ncbi:MAG: hypothetical protein NW215_06135 [Hyphomicrobiales bacterium]|nr:hypothetical protein [Hyphomicrobiales bacterium]